MADDSKPETIQQTIGKAFIPSMKRLTGNMRAFGLTSEEAADNFCYAVTGRDGTVDGCPKDNRGRDGETDSA